MVGQKQVYATVYGWVQKDEPTLQNFDVNSVRTMIYNSIVC